MKNISSLRYRTGCFSEGSKGPFPDGTHIGLHTYRLANSSMGVDELREELSNHFSELFGASTLSRTPSDKLRRSFLVERIIYGIQDIRDGKKPKPLW